MTTDSPIKSWIEERRTMAGFDGWTSDQITKAGLPRALDALSKVLELHKPMPNSGSALFPTPACTCGENYPCPTVQAIEGAING